MNTGVQIVKNNGIPIAAVLPWNEYQRLVAREIRSPTPGIPHDVVGSVVAGNSPIKAWRSYLGLTQIQAAEKLGITQGAYAQMEKTKNSQNSTLKKVASAFGITFDQIDII